MKPVDINGSGPNMWAMTHAGKSFHEDMRNAGAAGSGTPEPACFIIVLFRPFYELGTPIAPGNDIAACDIILLVCRALIIVDAALLKSLGQG